MRLILPDPTMVYLTKLAPLGGEEGIVNVIDKLVVDQPVRSDKPISGGSRLSVVESEKR